LPVYSDFPVLVRRLQGVRQKIAESRSDRANRHKIYASIEAADFPDLVKEFRTMAENEQHDDGAREAQSLARFSGHLGFWTAVVGLVAAVVIPFIIERGRSSGLNQSARIPTIGITSHAPSCRVAELG